MPVFQIDPLRHPGWTVFVQNCPGASVFHTPGWLEALRRTYGYEPIVLTTTAPGIELTNGVAVCRVNSWLTGRRMVSLPFSDHCDPLVEPSGFQEISAFLQAEAKTTNLRYVEFRPLHSIPEIPGAFPSAQFAFHTIDLRPAKEQIFGRFHKDSIRRKVQRAEREGLVCERGTSALLLQNFYRLFVMTRRRHGLPPTPYRWFCNLVECLGDKAKIYVASKDGRPVAALFILIHGKKFVYKYGGSDQGFSNLGGTPFLFWKVIEDAKAEGIEELDLGRSDLDNEGLITFKNRLGGHAMPLSYWRLSSRPLQTSSAGWMSRLAKQTLAYSPDALRIQVGNVLYRHLG